MEHDLLTWTERGRLWLRLGIRALTVLAAALVLIRVLPPLLSLFLPFVLGLIVAWLLNPAVRWLHRRLTLSRKVIALVLILLIFSVAGGALWGLIRIAAEQIRSLFENWSSVTGTVLSGLERFAARLSGAQRWIPGFSAEALLGALADWLRGLDVSGWLTALAERAPSMVSALSGFAVAAAVFLMASCLITGDYPRLRFFVTDRVPADARAFCAEVRRIFMAAFGGYLKSQLILTLGVFGILAVGFTAVEQSYGLVLAAALAVLDFIPLLGSGTVLVPWMAADLILGNYAHAIRLAVIWGIVVIFRRVAEPKILGDQTGLSPVLSLVGIYTGMRLGGVAGMIAGPLVILMCINLHRLGVFRPAARDLRTAFRDVRAILREGRN